MQTLQGVDATHGGELFPVPATIKAQQSNSLSPAAAPQSLPAAKIVPFKPLKIQARHAKPAALRIEDRAW